MTTKFPCRFGKYILLEKISTGGMAQVFRAKAFGVAGFEKSFALKRILPHISEDPEFVAMFIDEAKIAAKLHHANICQIVEFGRVGDSYFQTMEYIPGADMRTIRRRFQAEKRVLPPELCLHVVEKVCDGLDYAHRKKDVQGNPLGIIHRDISPQNILVSFEGSVKLIDFGIAKAAHRAAKTQAGQIKGKFSYLAPEQIAGQPLDGRVDLFALGIVLWELLTGRDLFVADSEMEILRMIIRAEVPTVTEFNPSLPRELDNLVLQALAPNPDDRYADAGEFLEEIQRISYKLNMRMGTSRVQDFMASEFSRELQIEENKVRRFADMSKELRLPEKQSMEIEEPKSKPKSVVTFSGRRLQHPNNRPQGPESSEVTIIQGMTGDSDVSVEMEPVRPASGSGSFAGTSPAGAQGAPGEEIMELDDADLVMIEEGQAVADESGNADGSAAEWQEYAQDSEQFDSSGQDYAQEYEQDESYEQDYGQAESYEQDQDYEQQQEYGQNYDPGYKQPQSYDQEYEPGYEQPQSYDQEYEPGYEQPQSYDQEYEPGYEQPQSHDQEYEPGYEQPQSYDQEYEPGYEQPQSYDQEYEPGYEQPQSYDQEYEPGYEQPQSYDQEYEPGYEQPQSYDQEYEPGYEQPQSYDQEYEPGYEQPQSYPQDYAQSEAYTQDYDQGADYGEDQNVSADYDGRDSEVSADYDGRDYDPGYEQSDAYYEQAPEDGVEAELAPPVELDERWTRPPAADEFDDLPPTRATGSPEQELMQPFGPAATTTAAADDEVAELSEDDIEEIGSEESEAPDAPAEPPETMEIEPVDEGATMFDPSMSPLKPILDEPSTQAPNTQLPQDDDVQEGATIMESDLEPLKPIYDAPAEQKTGPQKKPAENSEQATKSQEDWVITFNPKDGSNGEA
jgi:serine/threonine protein kinase